METAPPLYIAGEDACVPGKGGCVHVSGLCPLCAIVEGVGGEKKEKVENKGDTSGEGLVLAKEEDRGRRGQEEDIEQQQQGLLPYAVPVCTYGSNDTKHIV